LNEESGLAAGWLKGTRAHPVPVSPALMSIEEELAYEYEEAVAEIERLQAIVVPLREEIKRILRKSRRPDLES